MEEANRYVAAKNIVEDKVKERELQSALRGTQFGGGLRRRLGNVLGGVEAPARRARAALSDAAAESSAAEERRYSHTGHDVARLEDLADTADECEEIETQSEASGFQASSAAPLREQKLCPSSRSSALSSSQKPESVNTREM